MSATTTGRMPLKIRSIVAFSRKRWKKSAMHKIIPKDGRTAPNAAQIAPHTPHNLYPVKIAILTAKIPGAACASAIRSKKSFLLIQLRRSVSSASMSGSMA